MPPEAIVPIVVAAIVLGVISLFKRKKSKQRHRVISIDEDNDGQNDIRIELGEREKKKSGFGRFLGFIVLLGVLGVIAYVAAMDSGGF